MDRHRSAAVDRIRPVSEGDGGGPHTGLHLRQGPDLQPGL